ncbi:SPOR domain-containing protein [Alishewanella tabrizica]|uniref:Cell division protein DedD n=1 Tax=Alishewanella tabrizica TaxID=671278 RepID=A0ABQ2WE25_9ALTE|nr:SPOR domain-containing protein [Alishewanella tabrizica]GGW50972.1 cell division protein DedD [Alishewanella tabrizica]
MTAKFKHRLLGTSILVLAGIIFLPDLLDGEKQVIKDDFQAIPNKPEFAGVQQVTPFDEAAFAARAEAAAAQPVDDTVVADDLAEASVATDSLAASERLPSQQFAQVTVGSANATPIETAEPVRVPSNTTATETPATKTPVTVSPPPAPGIGQAAWVVRVGSFSNPQNANALVAKLRQAGFATFTRSITNANGQPLTSVFVGPELRKERLEQGLNKLQQLTGIERLTISNYQPTENN